MSGKERQTPPITARTRSRKMTTRTTISAKGTRASAVYTSIQRSRGRDKTTTTRQERRRTHRSNKVEAKAVTTRAMHNHQERDGPLTRRSLYCTTSLLIQTLFIWNEHVCRSIHGVRAHVKSGLLWRARIATSSQATAALYSRAAYRQRLQAPCGGRIDPPWFVSRNTL